MALMSNDGRPISLRDFVNREVQRAHDEDPVFNGRSTGETQFACPYCRGIDFKEGPHGGISVNFACVQCHSRFNDGVFYIDDMGRCSDRDYAALFANGRFWKPRCLTIRAAEEKGPERVFRQGEE